MESMQLFNDPSVCRRLQGLVRRLAGKTGWQDDMMQEALIHLWCEEEKHPGQSQSWYLQSCRYRLQNYLRAGRSVDSGNHFGATMREIVNGDGLEESSDQLAASGAVWDEMYTKDLISVLSPWLTPMEKKVLDCLSDGLSAREIAKRLTVSHTLVNKYRRRIADLAIKLGIVPLEKQADRAWTLLRPKSDKKSAGIVCNALNSLSRTPDNHVCANPA